MINQCCCIKMFKPFSLNVRGELRVFDRPQVMGIVNVTPDSFWAGSRAQSLGDISARAERLVAEGADFLDLGGCSTRPGSPSVSVEEELERVRLGLEAIRSVDRSIPVSVDTFRSEVALKAIEWGADMVNDVSGGSLDPKMFDVVAELRVPYILMHMRGTPENMQTLTDYENVTAEVISDLSRKLRGLRLKGVADVIVDPGFGLFSKTVEQNYAMMRHLPLFGEMLEAPVLVGVSRKSMITRALGIEAAGALNGTSVLNAFALDRGAAFLRVHDVAEAVQAVRLYGFMQNAKNR